jgi:hypothetical protein
MHKLTQLKSTTPDQRGEIILNDYRSLIIFLLISIVFETVAITILPYFIQSHALLLCELSGVFLLTYMLLRLDYDSELLNFPFIIAISISTGITVLIILLSTIQIDYILYFDLWVFNSLFCQRIETRIHKHSLNITEAN